MSDYHGTRTGAQIDSAVTEVNDAGNTVAARLSGHGAPTASTRGRIGDLYTDIDSGSLYSCMGESDEAFIWNATSSEAGIITHNAASDAHSLLFSGKRDVQSIGTFSDAASIELPLGDSERRATEPISTMNIVLPEGSFESWIKFSTAASGAVTITLPENPVFIGAEPTFGNGETWEMSIKDGVIIAAKTAQENS